MKGPKGPYKKIAPGIYQDATGGPVVNGWEVLDHLGLPNTDENQLIVLEALKEFCDFDIVYRMPGDPAWRTDG